VPFAAFFDVHVLRVEHAQAYAVARGAPGVGQFDLKGGGGAHVLGMGRGQVHGQAAQRAMADMHADQRAAGQQKRQQVAQA